MTRTGIGALVVGAVLVGIGAALRWVPVAALGASMLAATAVAAFSVLRRPKVRIERQIEPPRVTKGLPAIAYLQFTNAGRLRSPTTIALQPYGERSIPLVVPRLLRGQSGMRTYRLPTQVRGIFRIGPLEVTRADPFELVRVTQHHAGTEEIRVYPKIFPFRSLASGVTHNLDGPTVDTAPHGSITFHRLREYLMGDDLRMIHWKSTARVGQLMVRHNVDTSQPYTVVVLDLNPDSYTDETFETAVDAAASVVVCQARGKAPVQLRTTDDHRLGGADLRNPQGLLDRLTVVKTTTYGSVSEEIERLQRDRGGTALVVITGRLDARDLPRIGTLRSRFERLVVVSVDEALQRSASYPGIAVVSGHDEQSLTGAWNLTGGR